MIWCMKKVISFTVVVALSLGITFFCHSSPFAYANAFPGRIEAEDWDDKSDPQYEIPSTDVGGGQEMVGIVNGSWMDYNISVPTSGMYTVNFRVATPQNFAQFQVKVGSTILGTLNILSTGGWDTWNTVPLTNVQLSAGQQTIRIQSIANETANFNWTDWAIAGTVNNLSPTASAGIAQTITLPSSSVNLSGSCTDPDGSIASCLWTQTAGPATATAAADTPNFFSNTFTSSESSRTVIFSISATIAANFAGTSNASSSATGAAASFTSSATGASTGVSSTAAS